MTVIKNIKMYKSQTNFNGEETIGCHSRPAYQSSPFFEYYEDDIAPLYQDRFESLLAFNIQVMKKICELLQIQAPQETTKTYLKDSPHHDLRHLIDAKTTKATSTAFEYTQSL